MQDRCNDNVVAKQLDGSLAESEIEEVAEAGDKCRRYNVGEESNSAAQDPLTQRGAFSSVQEPPRDALSLLSLDHDSPFLEFT